MSCYIVITYGMPLTLSLITEIKIQF